MRIFMTEKEVNQLIEALTDIKDSEVLRVLKGNRKNTTEEVPIVGKTIREDTRFKFKGERASVMSIAFDDETSSLIFKVPNIGMDDGDDYLDNIFKRCEDY